MKKILLIGDYKGAAWHPLRGVDEEIRRILEGFDVTIREDYPYLKLCDMREYDLLINYADAWGKRAGTDFAGVLLGYVAGGGSALTLHNGIIAHALPEIEQFVGGVFKGHPPREILEYTRAGGHPITKEVAAFSMDEEPYEFTMDEIAHVNIIMEYTYKGNKYPAAWVRGYGSGRSCYLSMGHDPASFANEGFANLLRRGALWCVGEL